MSGYYWNKKLQSLKKTYDLKHLSPLFVVEHHLENILISPTQTKVNRNFQGTRIAENDKQDIFSDYYKFNENNHFVWTNQTVMNENITDLDTKIVHNLYMGNFNYTHCNLADPDKSFELRGKGKLGFGLYAKHFIPKNTVIGEYTGELIDKKEHDNRSREYHEQGLSSYFFNTATSMTIDGGPMGNHTRFINHSCRQNCSAVALAENEITIVTDRFINQGEELFLNYGKKYFTNLKCLWGENNCFNNFKKQEKEKKK